MGMITPSWIQVNPSYVMPEILLQYQQASGAFDLLAGRDPMARLSSNDLAVYIKKADIRTKTASGQTSYNQLPSVSVQMAMISTPTYLIRTRAEYDHHDTAASGTWGISIDEAQRLGMRQGTFQTMRNALLYGFNPANGEGLSNTVGATSVNLPADSNGNTTLITYDNGELATFLLSTVSALKTRTMQLGIGHRVVVVGPQRILGAMEYQNIVQLTQFQRTGAGTGTTKTTFEAILNENGDTLEWTYDDTLIGKGAGGNDLVIVTIPEVKKPQGGAVNTNEFARVSPGLEACNLMLCDMPAPREIRSPLAGGAIDVLSELRITPGWGVRPETLTLLSIQYS